MKLFEESKGYSKRVRVDFQCTYCNRITIYESTMKRHVIQIHGHGLKK